ncbi:MAG: class I SAM-dependent methyltransferase [Acetobacteraceae bacterium]
MTRVETYLLSGERHIAGWLSPYTAEFISALGAVQRDLGISGSVGEIGVHHGKLFVLLCLMLVPEEHAFAIDIFENQELNTDGSGSGDLTILKRNLSLWCPDLVNNIYIISKSSLDVTPDEVQRVCEPARLISVDGGHTAECVYNDLRLSQAVMGPGCVVALDDFFNEDWPDVSTGATRFLLEPGTRLRPFAVTPNKVFLTDPGVADAYRNRVREHYGFRAFKTSRMFGYDVDVFHGYPPAPPLPLYMRERLRASRIGPSLLRLKRFVTTLR